MLGKTTTTTKKECQVQVETLLRGGQARAKEEAVEENCLGCGVVIK